MYLLYTNVRQADDPCMRFAALEGQAPEVAVDRDQYTLFMHRPPQECLIARVGVDFGRFTHIVALRSQPLRETPPGTPIDEEFHPATAIRSIRSWAMTACA